MRSTRSGGEAAPGRARRVARGLSRCLALLTATALASLGALPANAHYVQPPGDLEAAPAIVQIRTTFTYEVTLHAADVQAARTYTPRVAGPIGVGAVYNPVGTVLTSHSIAFSPRDAARIEAANTAFNAYYRMGWAPAQLSQRQRPADGPKNAVLQQCYGRGGAQCRVQFLRRERAVVFNTSPARVQSVDGRDNTGPALTVLHTNSDREKTPTVGIDAVVAPDAEFVAMGYNGAGTLTRLPGRLTKGQIDDAFRAALKQKFAKDGDGVVLVNPSTKGTILGLTTIDQTGALTFVPAREPVVLAAYIVERGVLDGQIDQALGYFNGKHYTHAVPLLEAATKVLPDKELLADLTEANRLKGTSVDKSLTSTPAETDQMDMSGFWSTRAVVIAVLVAVGAVVGVVLLVALRRRRATGPADPEDHDGRDVDEEGSAVDAGHPPAPPVAVATEPAVAREPVSANHRSPVDESPGTSRTPSGGTTVIPAVDQKKARVAPYCPQCGVELVTGDRFCYHCGTPAR